MPSTTHMATVADDRRHVPGPGALPLWNESFWFTWYDSATTIGVVFRVGAHPLQGAANLYLFITQGGAVVHSLVDHAIPLAPDAPSRLALASGLTLDWEPLERFHLRYAHAGHGFDVVWQGMSPTYLYPHPPDLTAEQIPFHIEHAATVTGTVTIRGTAFPVRALAHRDHSWGGERDWAKMLHWDYLSAEFGEDLWVHAVRVKLGADMDHITLGCLWDGKTVQAAGAIVIQPSYVDGGTRQTGVDLAFTDEAGRHWHVVGEEVLVHLCVPFGRTWLKDGITRYRCGTRTGYGIHELGYVEPA
jgi:hypothetical protein